MNDLPKFPADRAIDPERLGDHLPRRPEPEGSFGDWLRHAWPGLGLAAFGLFLAAGVLLVFASTTVLLFAPLPLVAAVAAVVYFSWRSYRGNRGGPSPPRG